MDQTGGCAQVDCLLVGQSSIETFRAFSTTASGRCIVQFALILQKLESGAYERIGLSELDSRRGWFKKARLECVEIV